MSMNLQESIIKILREETTKKERFKKYVRDYSKEHGYWKTKEMFGVEFTDLARVFGLPINSDLAGLILLDNAYNKILPITYKEFKIDITLDGIFYWEGKIKSGKYSKNVIEIIGSSATPFWDGDIFTPVEINYYSLYNESSDNSIDLDKYIEERLKGKHNFDSVEELFSWYNEFYLPGVYDVIINKLLPQAQELMDDLIDSTGENEIFINESDPKTGTGKKPKGSGRRLYTDENPKDTVSVKFRTKEDIIDTLNKDSFKSKPHKRQSQIINLIHQRVRAAYQNAKDPETKKRLKRAYDYIESVKEKSKQKTIRLQKQEQNESELTEKCWPGYTQKGMKTMFGKRYPNCVKKTK